MVRRAQPERRKAKMSTAVTVPVDAPAWITVDLITTTLETWQPYYQAR
jgi:hypothetical protein